MGKIKEMSIDGQNGIQEAEEAKMVDSMAVERKVSFGKDLVAVVELSKNCEEIATIIRVEDGKGNALLGKIAGFIGSVVVLDKEQTKVLELA